MNSENAKRIWELVAGIIETDGSLHTTELLLLRRLRTKLGLAPAGETKLVATRRGDEAAQAIAELPLNLRQEALELLVEAAVVDGKVVPSEQRYLEAVAAAMGADRPQLLERIAARLLES